MCLLVVLSVFNNPKVWSNDCFRSDSSHGGGSGVLLKHHDFYGVGDVEVIKSMCFARCESYELKILLSVFGVIKSLTHSSQLWLKCDWNAIKKHHIGRGDVHSSLVVFNKTTQFRETEFYDLDFMDTGEKSVMSESSFLQVEQVDCTSLCSFLGLASLAVRVELILPRKLLAASQQTFYRVPGSHRVTLRGPEL